MYVTLVHVKVKPEFISDFIEATRQNHLQSVKEAGNCRFDILQQQEDPARFVLYEAYTTQAAAKAHKDTPHYQQWRDSVADWMASPRKGVTYNAILPEL